MRPSPRRRTVEHILVAGETEDLDAIQQVLCLLPAHTFGQVYVETDEGVQLPALAAPARVTITQLRRPASTRPECADQESSAAPAARGVLLAQAITGWTAEWMPDEPDAEREFTIWIGGRASDQVNGLCHRLAAVPERL